MIITSLFADFKTDMQTIFDSKKPLYEMLQKKWDNYETMSYSEKYQYEKDIHSLVDMAEIQKEILQQEKKLFLEIFAPYINFESYFMAKKIHDVEKWKKAFLPMVEVVAITQRVEYLDTLLLLSTQLKLFDLPFKKYPEIIEDYPHITELKENFEWSKSKAFLHAMNTKECAIFEQLLEQDGANKQYFIDIRKTHWTVAFGAITCNDLTLFKKILQQGANIDYVDEDGLNLFYFAIFNEKLEFAKELVALGFKLNINPQDKRHALAIAALKNNLEIMHYLYTLGFDAQNSVLDKDNLLEFVLQTPNEDLKRPEGTYSDVNATTFLHLAQMFQPKLNMKRKLGYHNLALQSNSSYSVEYLKILLQLGVDINKNNKSYSPLQFIRVDERMTEKLNLLLTKEIDINHQDDDGDTALHDYVILYGKLQKQLKITQNKEAKEFEETNMNADVIEIFKLNGLDRKQLMLGAFQNKLDYVKDAIKVLLDNKVKTDLKNKEGLTAYGIAKKWEIDKEEIVKWLL